MYDNATCTITPEQRTCTCRHIRLPCGLQRCVCVCVCVCVCALVTGRGVTLTVNFGNCQLARAAIQVRTGRFCNAAWPFACTHMLCASVLHICVETCIIIVCAQVRRDFIARCVLPRTSLVITQVCGCVGVPQCSQTYIYALPCVLLRHTVYAGGGGEYLYIVLNTLTIYHLPLPRSLL